MIGRGVGRAAATSLVTAAAAFAGPSTSTASASGPAAQDAPAATEPTSQSAVDPAAAPVLAKLAAAYAADRPLATRGVLSGLFDVAGRTKSFVLNVSGQTDGHGRYVHRGDGAGLLVNDGHDAYVYDQARNSYARQPGTAARVGADAVDASVLAILLDENPALLLTLTDDPAGLLRRASDRPITLAPATASTTTAAATTLPATGPLGVGLVLWRSDKSVTLRVDPDTGELLGSTIDYAPLLAARHAHGVGVARAVLVYAPSTHEVPSDAVFAWQPPITATEFALQAELLKPTPATRPGLRP